MPITLTGGNFKTPDGNTVTGILTLKLSGDTHISAGGQLAPNNVNITITAGNVAGTPSVFGNDELSPANTFYVARLLDSSGNQIYGPENWSLTGGGTLDIGTLNPLTTTPTLSVTTASLSELDVDTIKLNKTSKSVVLDNVSNALEINSAQGLLFTTSGNIATSAGIPITINPSQPGVSGAGPVNTFNCGAANTSGAGGTLTINGGVGAGSGLGGSLTLQAGTGGATGGGGAVSISAGPGGAGSSTNGGGITITTGAGNGASGSGGTLSLIGGSAGGSSGAGANISIAAGPGSFNNTNGGNVIIKPGTSGGGSGSPGKIQIQDSTGGIQMGMTLKSGTGAGNYDTASTNYVRADTTNLVFTTTIPKGWKLSCVTTGSATTLTAAVAWSIAIADGTSDNSGILAEVQGTSTGAGVAAPYTVATVVAGDGASHTLNLQFKTANAADHANIANGTTTIAPMMVFTLMPSN